MKAYTDLEQSKKLAEILPLESADMTYDSSGLLSVGCAPFILNHRRDCVPCWSLSALLSVLPRELHFVLAILAIGINSKFAVGSVDDNSYDCIADNPVDACYKLIMKLHDLKIV